MADTARTKAALLTLLADNVTGSITAQNARDFLETMHPTFGSLYFSTPAETTISASGTYVKAAGTTTGVSAHRVTASTSNRLTYDGEPDIHAHIAASLSMTSASNNVVVGVGIAKNGTLLDHSKLHRQVSTGTDVGSTAIHADVMLSTNDYLELFVANETNTGNLTIEYGYLFFLGMMV